MKEGLDINSDRWPDVSRVSASLVEVARDGRFLLLVPQVRAGERPIIVATAPIRSTQR